MTSVKMLAKYIKQVDKIKTIEGYTIADVKRISGYPNWSTYQKQLRKYGLELGPPVDSSQYKREQKYEAIKQAFIQAGNKNRISLDKARQILGCRRNHHARLQLDNMTTKYGLDVLSLVAYTPLDQVALDEDAEIEKRRQPEPLRVAGIPAKPLGDGWYQLT